MPLTVERGEAKPTRNHWWWRDGWGPGTRYITWHLTFEDSAELHGESRRASDAMRTVRSVDVVPVDWLHLTMTGVGYAGDIDGPNLASHAALVFGSLAEMHQEPLIFDRLVLQQEGVSLTTRSEWLQELRVRQLALVEEIGGPTPHPSEIFRPHVSLAYFSAEVDETVLTNALYEAELSPIVAASPRLSLIELGRDDGMYTWRVLEQNSLHLA